MKSEEEAESLSEGENENASSWQTLKERGRRAFERGDFAAAIARYKAALQHPNCPASEQQLLLSNMVAARLKIASPEHLKAAVENAKQCIAMNDRWAKGHVRLASVYIALGGYSNDACNALQRALQLDPRYPNARTMLVRELRRRGQAESSPNQAEPSAPSDVYDDQEYSSNIHQTTSAATRRPQDLRHSSPPQNPHVEPNDDHGARSSYIDDTLTWQQRMTFYMERTRMWYHSQSETTRNGIMVGIGIVLLYVAFGGRFGLESMSHRPRRGNYQAGNAYDQYYQGQRRSTQAETQRNGYHYPQSSSFDGYRDPHHQHHQEPSESYYSTNNRGRSTNSWSLHLPNLFDGSLQSIGIIAGIVYLCHRNGVNPMQVLMIMNVMNGGRGRRRNNNIFGYGFGRGGMMGGFGRPPRPRW